MPCVRPPQRLPIHPDTPVAFLAGSIEMGRAVDWQQSLGDAICRVLPEAVVCNPRRADWDSSWVQDISSPQFNGQVTWELDHLERADLAVFYFQPDTQSPISLMELGLRAGRPWGQTVVCCPPGFWRRGNVQIICARAGFPMVETLADLEKAGEQWARSLR